MRLSELITTKMEDILTIWEHDARGSLPQHDLSREAVRDHIEQILLGIAARIDQRGDVREELSEFNVDLPDSQLYAGIHGHERYELGIETFQVAQEFRALRMTVVELWGHCNGPDSADFSDLIRFNYEIDRVLEKSIERLTQEKEKQSRLYKTILSSLPDPCYILSLGGDFRYVNAAMAELCGLPAEQMVGRSFSQAPLPAANIDQQELQRIVSGQEYRWQEVEIEAADGGVHNFETVHIPVRDERGEPEAISGIAHDVTFRKDSEVQAWRHANFDPVTGLPNRRLFRDRLAQHAAHSQRTGDPFALFFIDLDRFKEINDQMGHDAGDHLLHAVAERLDGCTRHSDTVARIGGDEFTVLLLDTGDRERIQDLAGSILRELNRPFMIDQEEVSVSGSIGITLFPEDADSEQRLLNNADEAMYLAKRSGRNRFCFFSESMVQKRSVRHRLIEELREALEKQQLRLFFQPIIDLSDGRIAKAEALVRWQHPRRGLLLPGDFLDLAEQTGVMASLESWVFSAVAANIEHWNSANIAPPELTVNASAIRFMNGTNPGPWEPHLEQFSRASTNVAIELTENVLLQDSDYLLRRFSELKAAGIKLILDDFGTGCSALAYLLRFDIQYLKIDEVFIRDSVPGSKNRAIAETIIFMAHKLGIQVVAEGVETEEVRVWLKAAGCDFAQGYLFCKPLPDHEFAALLKAGKVI